MMNTRPRPLVLAGAEHPGRDQPAEPVGEHGPWRAARVMDLVEPPTPEGDLAHHQQRPSVTQHLQHSGDPRHHSTEFVLRTQVCQQGFADMSEWT